MRSTLCQKCFDGAVGACPCTVSAREWEAPSEPARRLPYVHVEPKSLDRR